VADWPKLAASVLIATALMVAIRTAKWSATTDARTSNSELDKEIDFAAHLARRVLSAVIKLSPSIFPNRKQPWYKATSEDQPSNLCEDFAVLSFGAMPQRILDSRYGLGCPDKCVRAA
jgi:hypothetical protein